MKVLIKGYDTCCQNQSGGVQIRIRNFYEALKDNGCDVSYFNSFESDLREYDILHVFKMDIESLALIRCAKTMGKKVVLSSIVNCINKRKIDFYRAINRLPLATTYRGLFEIVKLCDLIIVESHQERTFLIRHFGARGKEICIIANGAEDYTTTDTSIFDKIGIHGSYVLQVGRFDKNKNQLNVIRAMKQSCIHTVFIGGADINDTRYYDKCVREASGNYNFHFLGWIDNKSSLLKSAYSNAKVLVAPSYNETFGLTIIEGAIAGANLVLSKTLPITHDEHFRNCIICDPGNPDDIRKCIMMAIEAKQNQTFRRRIKEDFSWSSVAKQHIKKYSELLYNK